MDGASRQRTPPATPHCPAIRALCSKTTLLPRARVTFMRVSSILLLGLGAFAAPLAAQQPTATASPAQEPKPLDVGAAAPDFALAGATRFGVLRQPVHLSDFK